MGLKWKEKLTLDNLEKFATEFIKPTYLMAYKATLSEMSACGISVDALCKVFALREYYEETGEEIEPEKAIANAVEQLISKPQFANLHNPSITPDESVLPPAEHLIELVDKVVDKANAEMPRYAPVYSGTTGVVVIMAMVAVIVAAIAFICINPFAQDNTVVSDTTVMVDSISRLNPEYMVTLDANVQLADANGYAYNSGTLPITVKLLGPDRVITEYLSATDVSGGNISLYQYDKDEYCCIAEADGLYNISAHSSDGHTSYAYINVIDIPEISCSDVRTVDTFVSVSHGKETDITLFDSFKLDNCEIISAENFVSASDLAPGEAIIIHPQYGTLDISYTEDKLIYTADERAGLDSITAYCCTSSGEQIVYTLPIIVSNYAPKIDTSSLALTLVHTPSNPGAGAGRLSAADMDGDKITFSLVNSVNCSVLLSPNGSYLVSIDSEHSGPTASFSFTATDGLITTDAVTVTISLENHLIDVLEYSQDFICYGGDYFYTLDLPAYDKDGDPLTWTVISSLTDGLTGNGSRIITGDGSEIRYQISPDINKNTVEVIQLLCSDGWAQSPTVTLTCNISENKPPKAGNGNYIAIPLNQSEVTCTLNIKDDFELDKCVIDSVYRAVGGSVAEGIGWDELVFTFTPDGTESDCYVILTVRDTLTDSTANIRYTITRE